MELPHSQLIDLMIEEYQHTVTQNIPDPERRPARLGGTPLGLTAIRRRMSNVLRAIADRLEPSGTRSPGKHYVFRPHLEDGGRTACLPPTA